MSLISLSGYSSVLMTLLVSIKDISNRLAMWDTGANLNYMHEIEARILGPEVQPSNLGSVQVGDEAMLEVVGMVIACAASAVPHYFSTSPGSSHIVSSLECLP
jgi:hypothetical protein